MRDICTVQPPCLLSRLSLRDVGGTRERREKEGGGKRNRRRSLLCLHLGPRFLRLSLPAFLVSIFPFFLFLFSLFEESVFFYSFYLFLFFFFLLSFRVKRNAIHFCWHGSHPFIPSCAPTTPPGRCCRSRTVPPAACPAFSHAPRDQSHPPNRLRRGGEKMGPPNEKRCGKNRTTVQKQTKSKQVQHSIPQIKLDCYICRFGLPLPFLFFRRVFFIFLFPRPAE